MEIKRGWHETYRTTSVYPLACIADTRTRGTCGSQGLDPRGRDSRPTPHEGDRCAAHPLRFGGHEGEYRPLDGRCAGIQLLDLCQELWPRQPIDRRLSWHLGLAHTGLVERHEDQFTDARHDRFLDDPLLFYRRRLVAARHLIGGRDRWRIGRCRAIREPSGQCRRLWVAVYSGCRLVQHLRPILAPDLWRCPLATLDPRGLFALGERLRVPQPRQDGQCLRRADEHRRSILPHRTQPERSIPRFPPPAGGLLQHRTG